MWCTLTDPSLTKIKSAIMAVMTDLAKKAKVDPGAIYLALQAFNAFVDLWQLH